MESAESRTLSVHCLPTNPVVIYQSHPTTTADSDTHTSSIKITTIVQPYHMSTRLRFKAHVNGNKLTVQLSWWIDDCQRVYVCYWENNATNYKL